MCLFWFCFVGDLFMIDCFGCLWVEIRCDVEFLLVVLLIVVIFLVGEVDVSVFFFLLVRLFVLLEIFL